MRDADSPDLSLQTILEKRVAYFLSPLETFIHKQTTAGALLIIFSLFALLTANTSWRYLLDNLSKMELGIVLSDRHFSLSLADWVGQGLMALFFFLAGLEIKREVLAGKLRHFQEISLICLAALGGILVPAFFYCLLNQGETGQHGWGIPTATDTAFAIGVLALMARKVSIGMTVFLTALAIFDDIGAMIVMSVFYAHEINIAAIGSSALIMIFLFAANRFGIRSGLFYSVAGLLLWVSIFKAGIHPTFAGLLLAMAIPARTTLSQSAFIENIRKLTSKFERRPGGLSMLASPGQHSIISDINDNVHAASTPLQRWEAKMIMPISVVILPLFALLNAGFAITHDAVLRGMTSPVTLGIILGLVIGKPLGVLSFAYIGVKLKIGRLPEGVVWNEVVGVAFLAGIGFTMSIFFTTLSFAYEPALLEQAKLGILVSSIISATLGSIWIYFISSRCYRISKNQRLS